MKYVRDEIGNLYEALDAEEIQAEYVAQVEGKELSDNNFTDAHKQTVENIQTGNVTGIKGESESAYRTGDVELTAEHIKNSLVNLIYPVGSIYMSVNNVSPATLFGGTWEQIKDKFLLSSGDSYTNGATGGEANHTLTEAEMPSHRHYVERQLLAESAGSHNHNLYYNAQPTASGDNFLSYNLGVYAGQLDAGIRTNVMGAHTHYISAHNTNYTGSGNAHNNMPPYLAVNVWKRTA